LEDTCRPVEDDEPDAGHREHPAEAAQHDEGSRSSRLGIGRPGVLSLVGAQEAVFRPSFCSAARMSANGFVGSSAIGKQSSLWTIVSPFGVTVMSVLLETCLPTVLSKYHGLHQMSLVKFLIPLNAALTLSLVMSPWIPSRASVATRPAGSPSERSWSC
jgi:hypothetical protein